MSYPIIANSGMVVVEFIKQDDCRSDVRYEQKGKSGYKRTFCL